MKEKLKQRFLEIYGEGCRLLRIQLGGCVHIVDYVKEKESNNIFYNTDKQTRVIREATTYVSEAHTKVEKLLGDISHHDYIDADKKFIYVVEVCNIYNDYLKPVWSYLNREAKKIASSLYAEAKERYAEALKDYDSSMEYYKSSIEYYKAHDGYSTYPKKPERPDYRVFYKKAKSYSAMKKAIENFLWSCKNYNSSYILPKEIGYVALDALVCIKDFEHSYNAMPHKKYYLSLTHYMESYDVAESLSMEGPLLRKVGSTPYSIRGDELLGNLDFSYSDIILVKVED